MEGEPAIGYRARVNPILHRAIDLGIGTAPLALANAAGLSRSTIYRTLAGAYVKPATMVALTRALGMTVDEAFELVEMDGSPDGHPEEPPDLRAVT